jgi:hypothetical protein
MILVILGAEDACGFSNQILRCPTIVHPCLLSVPLDFLFLSGDFFRSGRWEAIILDFSHLSFCRMSPFLRYLQEIIMERLMNHDALGRGPDLVGLGSLLGAFWVFFFPFHLPGDMHIVSVLLRHISVPRPSQFLSW